RLQRPRAIKILSPAFSQRPALRRRFLSEAQTMATLEETHVVRLFDMGEDGDRVFIVMELVEGGSLVDRVKAHGPLPPRMACEVVISLCESLQGAHDNSVIHRDIKPHNVLLTRNGDIRITDFGIAQVQHENEPGMTRTGAVLGTWGFMAPEQKSNAKQVDARADIYSCGATLWSLLKNDTPPELFMSEAEPEWFEGIPEALVEVIRKATRYRREERYPTARSMADALRLVLPLLPDDPDDTPSLVPRVPERQSNAESFDTMAQLIGETTNRPLPAEGTMVPEGAGPEPGGTINGEGSSDRPYVPPERADFELDDPQPSRLRKLVPLVAGAVAMLVAGTVVWAVSPSFTGVQLPAEPAADPTAEPVTVEPQAVEPPPVEVVPPPAEVPPVEATPAQPVAKQPEVARQPEVVKPPPEVVVAPPPTKSTVVVTKVATGSLSSSGPAAGRVGDTLNFSATIGGKQTVKLYYRGVGSGAFREKAMSGSNGRYAASVKVDETMTTGLQWFVQSTDPSGKIAKDGSAMSPKQVSVTP
ncbi:MAG: serine/threonine protein kinase, partial [Deltaproteobacteria bacterium]|nr:serine/threonine protein kinase [Deltaproteobacteria bacterium]